MTTKRYLTALLSALVSAVLLVGVGLAGPAQAEDEPASEPWPQQPTLAEVSIGYDYDCAKGLRYVVHVKYPDTYPPLHAPLTHTQRALYPHEAEYLGCGDTPFDPVPPAADGEWLSDQRQTTIDRLARIADLRAVRGR
jgi:hypothetical protein